MRHINENDLKIINDYFEDSGVTYTLDDGIVAIEGVYNVARYLYHDNVYELLSELNQRTPIDENMSLIENLIDDLRNVFQSDSGTYYVIK